MIKKLWNKFTNWLAGKPNEIKPIEEYYILHEDPFHNAMLNAVLQSGKPCVGTVNEDGELEIEVLDIYNK